MSIETVTCIVLICNVCGDKFGDDEVGVYHLDNVAEAISIQADWPEEFKWAIAADGYAVCIADDESHASVRETFVRAESPQPEIPGQLDAAEVSE